MKERYTFEQIKKMGGYKFNELPIEIRKTIVNDLFAINSSFELDNSNTVCFDIVGDNIIFIGKIPTTYFDNDIFCSDGCISPWELKDDGMYGEYGDDDLQDINNIGIGPPPSR